METQLCQLMAKDYSTAGAYFPKNFFKIDLTVFVIARDEVHGSDLAESAKGAAHIGAVGGQAADDVAGKSNNIRVKVCHLAEKLIPCLLYTSRCV